MSQPAPLPGGLNRSPYSAVKVLMICWKDSAQNQFKQQLKSLAKELLAYNFHVQEYEIESKNPQQTLTAELLSFLGHDKPHTLLIIYYGGHGLNNKDKDCIWLRLVSNIFQSFDD
ncbi:uncharacterized protein B0I36DRAFT_356477 [Microdochium trichocladiopsis]|uniref:Caspase family protein n=1 Tax=Microdochium trichocladiopsis TaxID=1682393 RepID=A0A9P8XRV4_9PEZI|nr:uncharacterized protein B0I36DRAFT_356477 [Microdochium trichocladiopsis]KAH7010883.1 hypothetical protein B0I36DRAFT_356477 [Microdochium trichocladiopsis]